MSHILGEFDVQIDGNHQYEEGITEIDVYPVEINAEGLRHTVTMDKPLASTEIPSEGYSDDCWYDIPSTMDQVRKLPDNIVKATQNAVAEALGKQLATAVRNDFKYHIGDTVFITEHRFPGEVEHLTVDGGYIVNMANSGERAEFAESELEDYNQELWHRP
jgi:hypothetical protein